MLGKKLRSYFARLESKNNDWIIDPFQATVPPNFNKEESDQLTELIESTKMKFLFKNSSLESFWFDVTKTLPDIGKKALKVQRFFATSYLCEKAFSVMVGLKTKYRARLENMDEEMRVCKYFYICTTL